MQSPQPAIKDRENQPGNGTEDKNPERGANKTNVSVSYPADGGPTPSEKGVGDLRYLGKPRQELILGDTGMEGI